MDSKIIKILLILIFLTSAVQAVEFKGKFIQGHYIIGKTDPSYKLDVVGAINSNNDVKVNGVSIQASALADATALAIALG